MKRTKTKAERSLPPLWTGKQEAAEHLPRQDSKAKKGRTGAGRSIKVKPEAEKTIKEAGNRAVKQRPAW